MSTVAVIGSNAFSGAHFVDLLLEQTDYRVLGVSRSAEKHPLFLPYRARPEAASRFAFHQLDLNGDAVALQQLLARERPRYVVNFAAQSEVAPSWLHPEQWFETNAVALAKLTNFLKDQSWLERYVHISSPEVYGTCEGVVLEDAPLNPSTPYAASKAAGDLLLFTLVKQYGFPMAMTRATNVYGPGQQLFKIIPRTVIYLKSGRTIELHGGGRAVKSYIHIRDVCRGTLEIMERGRNGEIYHLSPDRGVSIRDLVEDLCRRLGKDFATATQVVTERPGQDAAYVIDSSKARAEFGWDCEITTEQGLAEVIQWVEAYWPAIQKLPLDYLHQP